MTLSVFTLSHERHALGFSRQLWALIHPYWHSRDWLKAWALLILILGLSFAHVTVSVAYNHWYRDIYNALENRNGAEFGRLLLVFLGIAALSIFMSAYSKYLTQILIMRWRRWLFERYANAWLKNSRHYSMQLQEPVDNPDQRLTQDVEAFTRLTLGMVLGFIQSVTSLVTFSVILWTVSGNLEVWGFTIPGYMLWAALVYSMTGSIITHFIGRHLIGLNNEQQKAEADVRFDLMRIRENAENIALQKGEPAEQVKLGQRFALVWGNFHNLVRSERNLAFFIGGYTQFSFVFPLTIAGPRLFSGNLQFGELMQLTQAFANVQNSLSWFIAIYDELVEWRAVADRLLEFDNAIAQVGSREPAMIISPSITGQLVLHDLQPRRPDGELLFHIDARVAPGRYILVQGPSGCGKSTLLRAIAGLWPFGNGEVHLPAPLYVIPQRPYLPTGTLRNALLYPETYQRDTDEYLRQVLQACRLENLQDLLDEEGHWEKRLSPGEQQRLAIARALIAKPDWLLLDEVTSALSLVDEERMYGLIRQQLPRCTVLSIGHRPSLAAHHDIVWHITAECGVVKTPVERSVPAH